MSLIKYGINILIHHNIIIPLSTSSEVFQLDEHSAGHKFQVHVAIAFAGLHAAMDGNRLPATQQQRRKEERKTKEHLVQTQRSTCVLQLDLSGPVVYMHTGMSIHSVSHNPTPNRLRSLESMPGTMKPGRSDGFPSAEPVVSEDSGFPSRAGHVRSASIHEWPLDSTVTGLLFSLSLSHKRERVKYHHHSPGFCKQ